MASTETSQGPSPDAIAAAAQMIINHLSAGQDTPKSSRVPNNQSQVQQTKQDQRPTTGANTEPLQQQGGATQKRRGRRARGRGTNAQTETTRRQVQFDTAAWEEDEEEVQEVVEEIPRPTNNSTTTVATAQLIPIGSPFTELDAPSPAPSSYSPMAADVPDSYYADFLSPYNITPHPRTVKEGEYHRFCKEHRPAIFRGTNYKAFRAAYIATIHVARVPIQVKSMILQDLLDPSQPVLKAALELLDGSPSGYKQAINLIEGYFGGEEKEASEAMRSLLELQPIRPDSIADLALLIARFQKYSNHLKQKNKTTDF